MPEKEEINESLLLNYIKGETDLRQKSAVEQWLLLSPENQQQLNDLKKTWQLTGEVKTKPVAVNVDLAWSKVAQRINKPVEVRPVRTFRINPWLSAAAAVVLLAGIYLIFRFMNKTTEDIILAAKNEIVIDTLMDGSVISLNKNSTLTYPEAFSDDERRVQLQGEAFFEIEPDAERPFIIELQHQSTVTVLGTSFNIEQNDSTTEVFVKTGKVEFASGDAKVILTPGEKAILDLETGIIQKSAAEEIDYNETYWLNRQLEFDDMPLGEVFSILSDLFDVNISVSDPGILTCPLTTKFERESLEQILDVIAGSFNLIIQKSGRNYTMTGDGC